MERHCSSALAIAELLKQHRAVTFALPPARTTPDVSVRWFSRLRIARRQERGHGLHEPTFPSDPCRKSRRRRDARPASRQYTYSTYTEEERRKHGISDGLIRFSSRSIGLETLSDLKDDILQALDAVDL